MPSPTRHNPSPPILFAFAAAVALVSLGLPGVTSRVRAQGLLLPVEADLGPLAIEDHRVSVTVRERVAETRVDQIFTNRTGRAVEARYVFPVPRSASVSGFAVWVDGRRVPGEVLEAGAARRVYEGIVARVRDPGLVEQIGGRLFRARVSPIAPGASQRVELRFTETLSYHAGVVHYRYPLRTGGPASVAQAEMSISVNIVSRTPIRAVYSPTHPIGISRPDDHHARASFEATRAPLDEDFDLYYAVQDRDVGLSLLTHRAPAPGGAGALPHGGAPGAGAVDDGYFVAMISPRTERADREISNKEILFVFDTSASMAGEKLRRAKSALDYMLARLGPSDHFQVVRFATDVEVLFPGGASVPATAANVAHARRRASRFVAAGGTALDGALGAAYGTRPATGTAPRIVVFLTDGMPTIGATEPRAIIDRVGASAENARLFVFGVGDDVNTTFLDQLATRGRGVGDYFRDGREMERRLSAFYDRIAYPLLSDLVLEFPGLDVTDVYPRDLGHLYRGGQLFIVGRYRGAGATRIRLTGRASHEEGRREFRYEVRFPEQRSENGWLPRLWATRKVGYLLDDIRLRGERREVREQVVELGRRFGLVTPYTNFLVVPDDQIPPGVFVDGSGPERSPTVPAPFEGFAEATSGYDYAPPEEESRVGVALDGDAADSSSAGSASSATAGSSRAPAGGTGARGRQISRQLRAMREADRPETATSGGSRFVDGRTIRQLRGIWVDEAYRRGMVTLRLRYAGPAYFALVRARPDLAGALAVGARLTLVVDEGRAVVIDPSAPAGVSAADVRRFINGGQR